MGCRACCALQRHAVFPQIAHRALPAKTNIFGLETQFLWTAPHLRIGNSISAGPKAASLQSTCQYLCGIHAVSAADSQATFSDRSRTSADRNARFAEYMLYFCGMHAASIDYESK